MGNITIAKNKQQSKTEPKERKKVKISSKLHTRKIILRSKFGNRLLRFKIFFVKYYKPYMKVILNTTFFKTWIYCESMLVTF